MLPLKLTTRAFSNSFLHFEKPFISHFQCSGSKSTTHGAWTCTNTQVSLLWSAPRVASCLKSKVLHYNFTLHCVGASVCLLGEERFFLRHDTTPWLFNVLWNILTHVQQLAWILKVNGNIDFLVMVKLSIADFSKISLKFACMFLCLPFNNDLVYTLSSPFMWGSCHSLSVCNNHDHSLTIAPLSHVFLYILFFSCLSWLLPGDAFPWSISLSQFSVYTLLGQQQSLSLLERMGCTSTLAVTSHKLQSCSEGRHSFVVCLHVDLQPVHVKCSNPQVSQTVLNLFSVDIRVTHIYKSFPCKLSWNMNTRTLAGIPCFCMIFWYSLTQINKLPHLLTLYNFQENESVNKRVLPCLFWSNILRSEWRRAGNRKTYHHCIFTVCCYVLVRTWQIRTEWIQSVCVSASEFSVWFFHCALTGMFSHLCLPLHIGYIKFGSCVNLIGETFWVVTLLIVSNHSDGPWGYWKELVPETNERSDLVVNCPGHEESRRQSLLSFSLSVPRFQWLCLHGKAGKVYCNYLMTHY